MLDHPVTQKFIVGVAVVSFGGIGGAAWTSTQRLERHDTQIKSLEYHQSTTVNQLAEELGEIRKDVGEIKTGVAVLQERTEHYERESGKTRP